MATTPLPQDICLLLCEELALRRDFGTLFNCVLVSKRMAILALEQLYSIHEFSPVATMSDGYKRLEWARLWRSIISSSVPGSTAYPYCAYIRGLSLGFNFAEPMYNALSDRNTRKFFFSGPMASFQLFKEGGPPVQRGQLPRLDIEQIVTQCGESLTSYIKSLADENACAVALTSLEANYIPHDVLPTWVSRLGTLTSLRIRDGSVIGPDVAQAIATCCPNFVDLTCFYCLSSEADENMAAFFRTLVPNTMRNFEILGGNSIGEKTMTSLNSHAASLTGLKLGSLGPEAMKSLNVLPECTALEVIEIENASGDPVDLRALNEDMLDEIGTWMGNCKSLRQLGFIRVKDAMAILKHVLVSDIKLRSLSVQMFELGSAEENRTLWSALAEQTSLQELTLGHVYELTDQWTVDNINLDDNPGLVESICLLRNLEFLNLKQANVRAPHIEMLTAALPGLTNLQLGGGVSDAVAGEIFDDVILHHVARLPQLKTLVINALSSFSWDALLHFSHNLNPARQQGIQIDILYQADERKFDAEQLFSLTKFFENELQGGKIEVNYTGDPDELHEDDFSDLSD